MSCWKYQGKCLDSAPEEYYGFVYVITDDNGKKYWGKKAFNHSKKTRITKKAKLLMGKTRRKYERKKVDSQWLSYWGSCKPLLGYIQARGGTQGFSREIIKLCKDRQSLAFWELHTLISNDVLFEDCWNGNVSGKYFKGKIHK